MSSLMERKGARGTQYVVRFRVDGAQRARSFTSRAAATRWQAVLDNAGHAVALALLDDVESGEQLAADLTVSAWVASYVKHLTGLAPGTRLGYEAILTNDITPAFGSLPLSGLTRTHVAEWVNAMAARPIGGSGKTVANKHGLLAAAMNAAVLEGHVAASPCRGIRLPNTSHQTDDMVILTTAQQDKLVVALAGPWGDLVLVLLRTGLRFGEATALPVRNLHLDGPRPSLAVTQTWKRATREGAKVLGPPKTKRGRRSVQLDEATVEVLARRAAGRRGDDLVLTAPRGGVIHSNPFRRQFHLALEQLDVHPRPRVHDLRHTHASMLIEAGMPLPHLQRRLGHESITTTIDTYGHLTADTTEATSAALRRAFGTGAT